MNYELKIGEEELIGNGIEFIIFSLIIFNFLVFLLPSPHF